MPIGGRMADKVGARIPSAIGIGVMGLSFWPLANLSADTPLPVVSLILFIGGLGSGLAMMAPNIVAMNAVESRLVSQAAGLSSVARQLSAAVGLAMLASFYATIRPDGAPGSVPADLSTDAFNKVFIVGMLVLVATFITTQFLPGKKVALELQEARRAEAADLEAIQAAHTEAALAVGMEG
jgi:MFS family permease